MSLVMFNCCGFVSIGMLHHVSTCNDNEDILSIVELQSILAALNLERSHHMDLCCKPWF